MFIKVTCFSEKNPDFRFTWIQNFNSVLINKAVPAKQVKPSFTNYKLRGLTSIKEKYVLEKQVLLENCLCNKKEQSKLEKRHPNNNTKQ